MKIGLLAYSSNTGLAYQTLEFAKHIGCHKILITDLSQLNRMPVHHERFEGLSNELKIYEGIPNDDAMEWLSDDVDLIFVCETPLNFNLFEMARDKGVKTIMQYNYEFLNYYRDNKLPKPDVLASPSFWYLEDTRNANFARVEYLPVPIDTEKIQPREITEIKTISHIGGRPAQHDRNGTADFIRFAVSTFEQVNYKDIQYQVFMQMPQEMGSSRVYYDLKPLIDDAKTVMKDRIHFLFDTPNYLDMYKDADLMILPRKYGGLCLPLWESLAHGIPVMMPRISPNNAVLPDEWLFEAEQFGELEVHSKVPMYRSYVVDLIGQVNNLINEGKYREHNRLAENIADEMSWERMKENYYRLFQGLLNERNK